MGPLFQGKDTSPAPQNSPTRSGNDGERSATRLLPETAWADESLPSGIPPEDAVVVTISRQFGSRSSEIAQLVAARAGLTYVDQRLIAEAAQGLGVDAQGIAHHDEQTSSMVGHILEAIQASNPLNASYLHSSTSTLAHANELAYLRLTQRVILEMASRGNAVIVGRGSQFLLHNTPRTLHISIFAPLSYRIDTIAQHHQLSRPEATRLIEQRDYEQTSYLRRYYGSDGQQAGLYHLLINTSLFQPSLAAHMIGLALPAIQEMR